MSFTFIKHVTYTGVGWKLTYELNYPLHFLHKKLRKKAKLTFLNENEKIF